MKRRRLHLNTARAGNKDFISIIWIPNLMCNPLQVGKRNLLWNPDDPSPVAWNNGYRRSYSHSITVIWKQIEEFLKVKKPTTYGNKHNLYFYKIKLMEIRN